MLKMIDVCILICLFSPLIGASLVGLGFHYLRSCTCQLITCNCIALSLLSGLLIIYQMCFAAHVPIHFSILQWLHVGTFQANWGVMVDSLTAIMIGVVTFVSLMVHLYSIGYMHGDRSISRFMAYLSLFTFFMLMLVMAPNLLQLFFGWEGVGLASYLLIGFWTEKKSANTAAMKAFLVNRIGDIFFCLGIFVIFNMFGSIDFTQILSIEVNDPKVLESFILPFNVKVHALSLICALLFIGATGKSAQLGLHVWLPDAMEGPTPVSALIHAATMVTAGIFLMVRISPFLDYAPYIRDIIVILGACTAFFAATVACTQTDIKRVIAYSTCSQLGFMFCAIGISAYSIAIFHLMTHAFFKALLFLGAGSVIHAFSGKQDLREMGGAWKKIPFTYCMMWIGSLALAGIPYLSGYYSKDAIMESLWATHSYASHFAFFCTISASLLTAFYSWRLIILAFHGKNRSSQEGAQHIHESPLVMTVPLALLSIGAIAMGFLTKDFFLALEANIGYHFSPEHNWALQQYQTLILHMHHLPVLIKNAPLYVGMLGISFAYFFYLFFPAIPAFLAKKLKVLYNFLLNKWYFDELYTFLFTNPTWIFGRILWKLDKQAIDKYGPDGMAYLMYCKSQLLGRLQTGYVYHYALAMILGVLALITGSILLFCN